MCQVEGPKLVASMGQQEGVRIEQVGHTLHKFQTLTVNFAEHFQEAAETMTGGAASSSSATVDTKQDIKTFISKCLRDGGPPKPPIPFSYDLAFSPEDLTADHFGATIFASSLENVLSYEQSQFPALSLEVPRVLEVLLDSIEKNGKYLREILCV